MTPIHIIDVTIVVSYLVICIILGLKRFGKIHSLRAYTLGHKPLATAILISTTFATAISAPMTIGSVEKSYSMGIMFVSTLFLIPIGWLIMSKLLAKNIDFFHHKKFLTLGDIMEHWYGKLGRTITSIGAILFALGMIATGNMAIGRLVHYFFDIPELLGMIIALSVVTVYSTFGGIHAIVITDIFQFLIFFIALPIACVIGYNDIGGYEKILKALPESHLTVAYEDIGLFIGMIGFALIPNADIPFIQRALVAKTKHQVKKTFTTTGILMFPLFIVIALIGFITYINNPNIHSDAVLFNFIKYYLPVGIIGIMIAGLLAVIMSTQDSFLNSTSTIITNDICKQIWPNLNEKKQLLIARGSCVAISAFSIFFVFIEKDILDLIWFIANFWDPLITIPFIVALAGVRINKKLFIIIPTITLISEMITRYVVGEFDTRSFTVGITTSIITTLIISRVSRKQTSSTVFHSTS